MSDSTDTLSSFNFGPFLAKAPQTPATPEQLVYSRTERCTRCGAGLAFNMAIDNNARTSWTCSAVLTGTADMSIQHEAYPFVFWSVDAEDHADTPDAVTTRPAA